MKTVFTTFLKLAFVIGLVAWLISSGKLDFGQLRIFIDHPETFAYNLLIWVLGCVLIGALRWFMLLRGANLEVSFRQAVRLQVIGLFFNTAIPGAVGGDVVKALYVMRGQRLQRRAPVMITVLLDRVVGLVGLFVMAGLAVAFNWSFVANDKSLLSLTLVTAAVFAAILVGFGIVFFPFKDGRDPIERLLRFELPGFSTLRNIYAALRSYRSKPWLLLGTVGLSCVAQAAQLAFAIDVTRILTGMSPDVATFATIYPLALMTTALPLAPGGLGVGHLAFDQLFHLVGWSGGANVFNVLILGQLCLNLLGVFPYLMNRSSLSRADDLGKEFETSAS